MANSPAVQAQTLDRVREGLRALDCLDPTEIVHILPELERVRAKLWLSVLTLSHLPSNVSTEPLPQLLTVKEVADRLRFSRGHVYELVRSRQLRGIQDGRTIRITREALAEWQATHQADQLDGSPRA